MAGWHWSAVRAPNSVESDSKDTRQPTEGKSTQGLEKRHGFTNRNLSKEDPCESTLILKTRALGVLASEMHSVLG